jgi:cytochrome c peroxidase
MGSGQQLETLRNAPTLLDLDSMTRYGWDGRHGSIEELIRAKLTSRYFGWKPGEEERALDRVHQTLVAAQLVDYSSLFQQGYRADVGSLSRDQAVEWVVRGLADYLDKIVSEQTSLWDAFAEMNRIPVGPSRNEESKGYAGRVYGRIGNQEGRRLIKRPIGFSKLAYSGFKIFFAVEGESSVGNCVSCHVPPRFSDFEFHNTGLAQIDYDGANGEGSYADLSMPGPETDRPVDRFLADPRSGEGRADLGYWNFVDLEADGVVRDGETAAEALARYRGSFKTPVLRNLQRTGPYMHNGAYESIDSAVREILRINQMARAGEMVGIDEEYRVMNLSEGDVPALVAFLKMFDEVPVEDFRDLLIDFEED